MAYDRHEPIGLRRLDLLFALQTWTLYNALAAANGAKEQTPLETFIPKWWSDDDEVDLEEVARQTLRDKVAAAFSMMNAGVPPSGS